MAASLNNLGALCAVRGEALEAHKLHWRAQAIEGRLIDQVAGFTSEERTLKFLSLRESRLWGMMSLAAGQLSGNSQARRETLDVWLRRKGVTLEAQKRFQEALALVYSDSPEARKVFQELAGVRAELSRLTFAGPGKEGPEAFRKKLAELNARKEELEARLSRLSQAYAASRRAARATCQTVAQALPQGSVLLELARFKPFNFKAKGREERWGPALYLAFVPHAGQGEEVGLVDLGRAEPIEEAIAGFKKDISDGREAVRAGAVKWLRQLHDLVFAPLKKELGEARTVFISPDGQLNLIPFEALMTPEGRYLIEDYTFNYLAAGRDVLVFGQVEAQGGKALLLGDPDYDLAPGEKSKALNRLGLKPGEERAARRSAELRDFIFKPLPGARQEVKAVVNLLGKGQSEVFTGKAALEEVLQSRPSPRILHLATHGFFLADQPLDELAEQAGLPGMQAGGSAPALVVKGKPVRVENPLLRSGIALAGANRALRSQAGQGDGIVTAEEILGLRLRGTEMVVLSACETGLGEVRSGEGVFGLRRAFTQAGAKSLVMSMWSVPDSETMELMIQFYKNITRKGLDRCQALRQAALRQMKVVEARYGQTSPLFWAAFVFMGQPE